MMVDARSVRVIEARVIEELPSLVYRLELENHAQILAHTAGSAQKNFVRLLPGDRVEVELAAKDLTRGRITKKL
jgi:translation initiation factor IF-1